MEEELTCGHCKSLLVAPVNLPCSHNVCYACAKSCTIQTANTSQNNQRKHDKLLTTTQNLNDHSDCHSDDSGYLSIHELHACLHQQFQGPILSVKCPKCNVSFILDDRGIECLPKNFILENLVEKHKAKNSDVDCELCEKVPPIKATVTCEQCRVSYCSECLAVFHPKRGPLAKHSLVAPNTEQLQQTRSGVLKCREHGDENISMYCALCKMPVCYLCFEEGRHCGHEAKALGTMFKEQKVEMLRGIEDLTKNKDELDNFIKDLAIQVSKIQENGIDLESRVVAQIDEIIACLEDKKSYLLKTITELVENKISQLTDQRQICNSKYTETKGLVEYSEEVTKELDPATFLMISSSLCSRLAYNVETWIGKKGLKPVVTSEMEIELSTEEILEAMQHCKFQKATFRKKVKKPGQPVIQTEKCSVENNMLILCWDIDDPDNQVEHYGIDVDDGMNGSFQTVHNTKETTCTLGGIQFKSTYRARVQAFNSAGEGKPSDLIYLTSPDVGIFTLDPATSHQDITLSNNSQTMTTTSFENRVALGSVGFSRGVHYWEVTIDRYEGNPDPAIGVAHANCTKDAILGRDSKAWSVYVDNTRSWFQHNNAHLYRSEGGIEKGSVIGLLLDLDHCQLTFHCNDEKHGPIEFPSLEDVDVVYPAFSMNRNVTMTVHTGLYPPSE